MVDLRIFALPRTNRLDQDSTSAYQIQSPPSKSLQQSNLTRFAAQTYFSMLEENKTAFSISIVSHGHQEYIISLLRDLAKLRRPDIEVILTWNLTGEEIDFDRKSFPFPIRSIRNDTPKGFAANHNYAFRLSTGVNFVILNPDISVPEDPFFFLIPILENHPPCICAPLIKTQNGEIEDSARFFPSPFTLIKKAAAKIVKYKLKLEKVPEDQAMLNPDWIAGMFMVIPHSIYKKLGGLSERYYLYYEDVDFCARARQAGIEVYVSKLVSVVHYAQRKSHNDSQFFRWHVESALRFLTSRAYILLMFNRTLKKIRHLISNQRI
jgi:N-acetylglucosaminyl-diphospho-decaprenol L-rhamnosyltransferase